MKSTQHCHPERSEGSPVSARGRSFAALRMTDRRVRRAVVEVLEERRLMWEGYGAAATGGAAGQVVTVTTAAQFRSYVTSTAPYVIQVSGTIDLRTPTDTKGRVDSASNKTIRGVGNAPTVIGNLNVTDGNSNVIVQNVYWTNPGDGDDGLTIWDGHNVVVDHVSFYDCGDGMCDVNNGSNDVTVSWCKFYYPSRTDHRFTMIADGTSTAKLRITLHHNWWADRCDQRMPASSNGQVHAYNNYFSCTGNFYCSNARNGTEMLIENSVYENVNGPVTVSSGTTGKIRTSGNQYINTTGTIHPGTDTVFTPGYAYTLTPTANVKALVMANAGVQPPSVAMPANATMIPPTGGTNYFVNPTGANGAFTTIQAAINAVPAGTSSNRTRIYVAPGTYTETTGANANLNISKAYVSLIGTGASPSDVVIQNAVAGLTGATRLQSGATDFVATNLTFSNTFGDNNGQAVALRGSADRATFKNCRFIGFQDTLLVDNNSRQYFKDCYITGDTDFIFGNATAVFDTCTINSTDAGYVTAAETSPTTANGLIFLDCTLTASGAQVSKPNTTYLGRPWHWDQGKIPSTIYIRTRMGPHVIAAGWNPWDAANNTNPDATTRYSEFGSMDANGAPLNTSGRVSWADPMTAQQAANYTLTNIFGPASFWTAATQPETTGVAYTSQGANWDAPPAVATLQANGATQAVLSVLGTDNAGESNLTYTWSLTGSPPAPVTYSVNGTNGARQTVATFTKAGTYNFLVTITDADLLTTTSAVTVVVQSAATSVNVSSSSSTPLVNGQTRQFTATATDQFGNAITSPTVAWSIDPGGDGSIDSNGLYTTPASGPGSAVVRATVGSASGTASVPTYLTIIEGTAGNDTIGLTVSGSNLVVTRSFGSTWTVPLSTLTTLTINAHEGADTVNFSGALSAPVTLTGTSVSVNVVSGASVQFGSAPQLASLNVSGLAVIAPSGSSGSCLVTGSLSLPGTGTLDLNNNDLIIDYSGASPLNAIQGWINSARANGAWTGSGLTSSAARNNASHNTTLGAIERADYANATFDGEPLDADAVLVKYTYYGDANFDGRVTFDDYVRIDTGFAQHQAGWSNGDFNGDGAVNFDDYVLIDSAFNTQGSPLSRDPFRAGRSRSVAPAAKPK